MAQDDLGICAIPIMIDRRGLGEKVIRSVIIKHVPEDTLGNLSDIDNT